MVAATRVFNFFVCLVLLVFLSGHYIHDFCIGLSVVGGITLLFGADFTTLGIFSVPRPWLRAVVGVLLVAYVLHPLLRYHGYQSLFWDLGCYLHMTWRCAHGLGATSTAIFEDFNNPVAYVPNNHLSLCVFPFTLLYKLIPYADTLLILQSLCLLGACFPLYRLAQELTPKVSPWYFILLLYLWNPFHRVNAWDFHEPVFMFIPGLWAYYFFIKKKWWAVGVALLAMAACKEDAWVVAGAMGAYFFLIQKKPVLAGGTFITGFLVFFIHGFFFNKVNGMGQHYAFLGETRADALRIFTTKPWVMVPEIFKADSLLYLLKLSLLGGGLWLFSGMAIIPAVPTILEHMLASSSIDRNLNAHYVLELAAPLFFATITGVKKLESWQPKNLKTILSVALLLTLTQFSYSEPQEIYDLVTSPVWKERKCYANLVSQVPQNVPLRAADPLSGHLSARKDFILYWSYRTYPWEKGQWGLIPEKDPLPAGGRLVTAGCGFKLFEKIN